MIVVTIPGPTRREVIEQVSQAEEVGDIVELRADLFNFEDLSGITSKKPLLLTGMKNEQQIGQIALEYIDLSFDDKRTFPGIKRISSYHNFDETPVDLEGLVKLMPKDSHIIKICTMAKSTLDALRMLECVKRFTSQGVTMVGHCMGEFGQISRVLGKIMGNTLTYACLKEPVAPGQLSASTLLNTYHLNKLNRETALFGLIGNPVKYSISHETHNAYFFESAINAVYVKMHLLPEELQLFFELASRLQFKGVSITMPFKEEVRRFCTCDVPVCNTIKFTSEGLFGCNTDGEGAALVIEKRMDLRNQRVVILGAGGSAYGIGLALKKRGAKLTIVNRTKANAERVAKELGATALSLEQLKDEGYDLLINTTPVGMGNPHEMPIDPECILGSAVVLDVISNPAETMLIREAQNGAASASQAKRCSGSKPSANLDIGILRP